MPPTTQKRLSSSFQNSDSSKNGSSELKPLSADVSKKAKLEINCNVVGHLVSERCYACGHSYKIRFNSKCGKCLSADDFNLNTGWSNAGLNKLPNPELPLEISSYSNNDNFTNLKYHGDLILQKTLDISKSKVKSETSDRVCELVKEVVTAISHIFDDGDYVFEL
ncbi:hypothetical protein GJ496_011468 [Pomphorhynchus laevis]|nr:hypothetical protein GJ496_011468 [Pomphorhynchus laevis]